MAAGVLVAPGLMTSAGADVVRAGRADAATANPVCLAGEANSYEFYTWCQGTSPASYRTIAYCSNGEAVLGVEEPDGSGDLSYADCSTTGTGTLSSTLSADWGVLECSNVNGSGIYAGYVPTSGDISWILYNWGAGTIATGGTTLCDYSIGEATVIATSPLPT